jgi:methionine synthase I (cobalamin-dependent)/5,10-methylenetetrahydrofolate reductase
VIHSFTKRLDAGGAILADGAMGTQLYERLGFRYLCFEELNVSNPQLVQGVHRSYLNAGAELIETNTFGCNRYLLGMRGLEREVERFAQAGARIAREAREAAGQEAFVAGAVGPINRLGVATREIRSGFQEVVEGLLLGGVDLFVLETFGSLDELLIALEVAKASASIPVIASMTFSEDGLSLAGEEPSKIARDLTAAGADVIAANCGFGPQPTLEVIEAMSADGVPPLGAMPNAGLPARVDGRLVYTSEPEYFADYARKFVGLNVKVIGGCCGTTPTHIARMREALDAVSGETHPTFPPEAPSVLFLDTEPRAVGSELPTPLRRALDSGQFVVSVEMRPSRGANVTRVLANAELLKSSGVTAVDVTDSALGRVRMNPFFTALLIHAYTGLDVVPHLTTRDRNIMALQADLLGAHALGVRHVLCLTGDPPNPNSFAPASGVYDVDSIGLIALVRKLNQGQDGAGTSIGSGTNFLIGCSLNPTAEDLDRELDRFRQKLDAGADFVMTQAVYDPNMFLAAMERIGPVNVPILLEVLPLQSFKNAEFIHNELAGVTLPEAVLERMRAAGSDGQAEGLKIAQETIMALAGSVQGVYIIPSFDRYEQAADLARWIRTYVAALASPAINSA